MMGDGPVHDAAYMWTRHRWVWPFAGGVFAATALLAPVVGIEDWPTRIVIAAALMAVSVMAATEYRVLAQVGEGFALFKASRIRQVATELKEELPTGTEMSPAGGSVLASDWKIGDTVYTVPRSSDTSMARMATTAAG